DQADAELAGRLTSALGETPPELAFRLERLVAVGLGRDGAESRHGRLWAELGPRTASAALRLALCAGMVPLLWGLFLPSRSVAAPLPLAGLAAPTGLLLLVEALRGAPTIRALLR